MKRKTMAQLIREQYTGSEDRGGQRDDIITQLPTPSPSMATLQRKYADPAAAPADATLPEVDLNSHLEVREVTPPSSLLPSDRPINVGKRLTIISTINGVSTEMGAQG